MDIERIKDANPIEEVMAETHPLKGGKARYLRSQEHDSLVVDIQKQYYVWNSQGQQGDVITWLEKSRGWDFKRAVEFLCNRAGLPAQWDGQDQEKYQAIRQRHDTLTQLADYLRGRFWENASATGWAYARGWTEEALGAAKVGFWDGNTRDFREHLRLYEIDPERPEVVALTGKKGGDLAAWANKWKVNLNVDWVGKGFIPAMPSGMFVYTHWRGGRCVYLTGRSIEGKRHYNMPLELAGEKEPYFNHAYYAAAEHVVVVEGQADALSLAQWEIPAVALTGLYETPGLIQRLLKHEHVYVALDDDKGGKKRTDKLAELLGAMTRVVTWPKLKDTEVKDANDWLKAGGTADECRRLLGEAPIFAEYLTRMARIATSADPMNAQAAQKRAIKAISELPDFTFAERKKGMADTLGITQTALHQMVKALQKGEKSSGAHKTEVTMPNGFLEDHLFEMVFDPKNERGPRTGLAVRYPDGSMRVVPALETDTYRIMPFPPFDSMLKANVIRLPSQIEPYDSEVSLQKRIQEFIHKYVDLPYHMETLASYYVMMTWLFDVFYVVPYLRARGNSDSGKSRFTEVIGQLCMRSIFVTGSTTPSPVFRTMEKWGGLTLVMDEADLPHSETSADWVQMFNTGYKRGFSILRTAMKEGDATVEAFNAFGPKVINMRGKFVDDATESRCLTWDAAVGRGIRADIPRYIVDQDGYLAEALSIRNQLLAFRLRNYGTVEVDYNAKETVHMPGRLIEITVPLMSISREPQFKQSVMDFIATMNQQAIMERSSTIEAKILEAILRAYYVPDEKILELSPDMQDKLKLQVAAITRQANRLINRENAEVSDGDDHQASKQLYAGRVGKMLTDRLMLRTEKANVGTRPMVLVWDMDRINALVIRYGMEDLLIEMIQKANERELKAAEAAGFRFPPTKVEDVEHSGR